MNKTHVFTLGLIGLLILSGGIASSVTVSVSSNDIPDSSDLYQLLIIAPSAFSDELSRLVDHKNDIGMKTELVTIENIRSLPETDMGRDDAEKMKYYIKYAMETHEISYVLLVGGRIGQSNRWYLPVRYVSMDNGWEPHYISDLYFADIYDEQMGFSSWDSDGDGNYGEWVQGEAVGDTDIDLYPDIAVGRLPVRNPLQLSTVVDKIISYETGAVQSSWFNRMLAIAGDTYLEYKNPLWAGIEGEYYADLALSHMNQFDPTRLYLSENAFSDPSPVIDAFNDGYGFVYFVGHGNPNTWGTHKPNDKQFVVGMMNADMNKLDHAPMYPVCVVSGCHNLQFDVHILNVLKGFLDEGTDFFGPRGSFWHNEWVPESWGWKMTRIADGGSIVTYGATALGHTKEDKESFTGGINELEVELFHQIGQENVEHAGDVLKNTISWYLDTYPVDWQQTDQTALDDMWVDVQVVQSYILFGDPSLRIGG